MIFSDEMEQKRAQAVKKEKNGIEAHKRTCKA